MTTETISSKDAVLGICLLASFADGEKSGAEHEEIRKIAEDLGSSELSALSRQILTGKITLETLVAAIDSREHRTLAYEMALAVCEVCGTLSEKERFFLTDLRTRLGLGQAEAMVVENEVDSMALVPVAAPQLPEPVPPSPHNDALILKYAILNGALELLPESLSTMAIIPMQLKMVYDIGQSHGVQLDRSTIKEFVATAGVGLGSQIFEGFARKMMGGLGRSVGGKFAGKAADQITGSAISFASTYALGHVAEQYYEGGRKLDKTAIQETFNRLKSQATDLHARYLPEIQSQAANLNPSAIIDMVRGSVKPK